MNRAKRHKQPVEDLDAAVDDILNNPITKSNLSFLVRPRLVDAPLPLTESPTRVRSVDETSPDNTTPDESSPDNSSQGLSLQGATSETPMMGSSGHSASLDETSRDALSRDVSLVRVVRPDKVRVLALGRPPLELGRQWVSLSTGKVFHVSKVQWVSIAQQAMTPNQERFYETIWRSKGDYHFEVETISRQTKRFCAGYDVLSRICRIASRNVRIIIPLLVQKQILVRYRNYQSKLRQGTTYDVFSYEEILRRQRAAGLCYVAKSGPGIDFVVPETWATTSMDATSPDEASADVSTPFNDNTSRESLDGTSTLSTDVASTPLDKGILLRHSTTTLRALLQLQLPTFDDSAVDQIWMECRNRVPDVTPEQIAILFQGKLLDSRARGVSNRNGFLLHAVPKSCTPAAIAALRQGRELPKDVPMTISSDELEEALNDPNTPPQMRSFIEQRLRGQS